MTVNITVMFTSDYCGGAYPTDQIVESLKKSRPYVNGILFVLKENSPLEDLMQVKTSDSATLTLELAEGNYQLFLPEKIRKNIGTQGFGNTQSCLDWRKVPNGTFLVSKGGETIEAQIHKTCNPCVAPPQ